jgi:NADP-dependent 3-hydroxy acid dehydrogenase YdfG
MAQRAAIVTGGSSGIGFAIARMLLEEGYGVTVAARRPEKLAAAVEQLLDGGGEVESLAVNMASDESPAQVVAAHRERFGRLDVLVNNAGVGIGALVAEIETKRVDMQLGVNLRSVILFYREAVDLLRAAGAEHRNALVVNTSSISGKDGVKSTALCPAFVDTPMTDFVKQSVPAESMIQVGDVADGGADAPAPLPGLRHPRDHFPAARGDDRRAARVVGPPTPRKEPCR